MNRRMSLACLLMLIWSCGCDGVTTISGRVLDSDGKPVGGVTVHVEPADSKGAAIDSHEAVTNAQGDYVVDFSHAPVAMKFKVTVTHAGYLDVSEELSNGQHNDHVIRMRSDPKVKKDDAKPGAAKPP